MPRDLKPPQVVTVEQSTDPSDVVADAAMGICSSKQQEFLVIAREKTGSSFTTREFDRQLRSLALGKVAAARAEMNRRQQLQTPKIDQPPVQEQKRSNPEKGA
jgi:hypothetical protein